MGLQVKFSIILAVLSLIALVGVGAADEAYMKEARCLSTTTQLALASNVDYAWLAGVPVWYFGYTSQLDMYRTAADMLDRPVAEIKDEEVYYDGCTMVKWVGANTWFYGYGRRMAFPLVPKEPGVFTFNSPQLKIGATIRMIQTDNRSYVMSHICWEDDEASWSVMTTIPPAKLDKATRREIETKLHQLRFKNRHAVQLRYDGCDTERVLADNPPAAVAPGSENGKDEF